MIKKNKWKFSFFLTKLISFFKMKIDELLWKLLLTNKEQVIFGADFSKLSQIF